eukprot:scaffold130840_cov15-Tisochrysis_lutea.AAC.1
MQASRTLAIPLSFSYLLVCLAWAGSNIAHSTRAGQKYVWALLSTRETEKQDTQRLVQQLGMVRQKLMAAESEVEAERCGAGCPKADGGNTASRCYRGSPYLESGTIVTEYSGRAQLKH